jgi:DNA polymerase-3 subunit alpha
MEKFAGYGFNRSHAAPYALLSYQTAYLKANHIREFYVATMNLDITNTDKISMYVQDARRNGIKVLPPDINKSEARFKIEEGNIRYALGAMKGSSITASEDIIAEREKNGDFKDMYDFFERLNKINKRQIETLVISGSFDSIHNNRNQVLGYYYNIPSKSEQGPTIQKSLFALDSCVDKANISNIPEWPLIEKLEKERRAIGFYLNKHPMDVYSEFLRGITIVKSGSFEKITDKNITVAGVLINKKEKLSKNAQKYAFINVSDQDNTFEVSIMPNVYQQASSLLAPGRALLLEVSMQKIGDTTKIIANSIQDVEYILNNQKIYLELSEDADIKLLEDFIKEIENGDNSISFIVPQRSSLRKIEIKTKYKTRLTIEIRKKIKNIKGVKFYELFWNFNFRQTN